MMYNGKLTFWLAGSGGYNILSTPDDYTDNSWHQVVAVYEDIPGNSHLKPEILIAFSNLAKCNTRSIWDIRRHILLFSTIIMIIMDGIIKFPVVCRGWGP